MVTQLLDAPKGSKAIPDDKETAALLAELARLSPDDPERDRLRAEVVEAHLPVARSIAHRYVGRGEPMEDILQAALLGLVKAINRYDPEIGDRFLAYASPMMAGEVKRHFRDRTWAIRVSRRFQELRIAARHATREFTATHQRSPTVAELAKILKISEEEAVDVLTASEAYQPISLDAPVTAEDGSAVLAELTGDLDQRLEHLTDRESVWPLINELPARERTILLLRFFGNQTQTQIAEQMGISQMHVSRILSATLTKLREQLLNDD